MNNKFLPIGSVCRLKEGQKNVMIIGFCSAANESQDKVFDYMGCLYPEGVFSSEINFLFNHEQIEEILFRGFENEEEKTFKNKLNELITNGTIDGKPVDINEINEMKPNNNTNSGYEAPQMFNPNNN